MLTSSPSAHRRRLSDCSLSTAVLHTPQSPTRHQPQRKDDQGSKGRKNVQG